jgi:hypothetical protein
VNDVVSQKMSEIRSVGLYLLELAHQQDINASTDIPAIPLPRGADFSNQTIDIEKFSRLAYDEYIRRRARNRFLPADIFGEPAWDMLLDLFVAHVSERHISISSACIASDVPCTTALRWISVLEDMKLIVREPDVNDRRRIWIKLSKMGFVKCKEYLEWVSRSERKRVYKYGTD